MLRVNAGEPFYHPVTHVFVPAGAFYAGAAHQDHESEVALTHPVDATETSESLVQPAEKPAKKK